jgi:predicted transposase/invertase (TIGR01784 family)
VVIYPTRSVEQTELHPFQDSFASSRITRIYLDELGNIDRLPLGISLMVLTILEDETATVAARDLIDRSVSEPENGRAIIELVATIIAYKFVDLSRVEIEAMLGVSLEDSRAFREVREEGKAEGKAEGKREEGQSLILRMLTRRFGEISPTLRSRIQALPLPLLEELGEALLDFTDIENLITWLDRV